MFNLSVKEILDAAKGALISGDANQEPFGISTDTRTIKEGELFLALKGKTFDGDNFIDEAAKKGAAGAIAQLSTINYQVRSEAKPPRRGLSANKSNFAVIQVKDTLEAYGNIAHCYRMKFDIPFIGITGSSGKTTTKDMVYKVLSSRFRVLCNEGTQNNIIGLSRALLRLDSDYNIGAFELGTNHFGEIKRLAEILKPDACIILNIGSSHLEFLRSKTGVLREKAELVNSLDESGIAVLNADDAMLSKISGSNHIQVKFGINKKCDFKAGYITQTKEGIAFNVNGKYNFKIKVMSPSYVYNALAAIAVGFLYKIDFKDIQKALIEFEPAAGRLCLKKVGGISIIDDTYNSNPHSLRVALATLPGYQTSGRKIFVFGDMLELGKGAGKFHAEAGRLIAKTNPDYLIAVGSFSEAVKEAAIANGMDKKIIFICKDNRQVLDILNGIVKQEDVVLLKGSRGVGLNEVVDALSSVVSSKRDMVRV